MTFITVGKHTIQAEHISHVSECEANQAFGGPHLEVFMTRGGGPLVFVGEQADEMRAHMELFMSYLPESDEE